MTLTHLSLFSGIGGIDLAAEWAGFETILFVEKDKFCQKVLNKHWPDVPIIGDIHDVTRERIEEAMADAESQSCNGFQDNAGDSKRPQEVPESGNSSGEGQQRSNSIIPPVTLITGGFPCQPVSHAGKRGGTEDDRWLWPEMLRVISEVRATWVVAENVTGLLTMGFYDCLSDLESQGYETQAFVIPACGVNAPHRRDRIFIVGYTTREGLQNRGRSQVGEAEREKPESNRCGSPLKGLQDDAGIADGEGWWAVEPDVGRVAHGIPSRVDRLKALGNAVVPQQIYPILKAIADIETSNIRRK